MWSHLYSYSFEQKTDWTREYPGQEEILDYLIKTAEKYDLFSYIRFNTTVESAAWSDAEKRWKIRVTVAGGKDAEFDSEYEISCDFLVSAVGQLNMPKIPEIPGMDEYKGHLMHSARWDWSYSLEGKNVAVIGNGPTAAQIIPEIAPVVKKLTVYQRTPNWVIPRLDAPISPFWRAVYKYIPPIRHRKRSDMMDFRESFWDAVFDNKSVAAQGLETMSKDLMHSQLPGREDLWEKLQPKYKIGCKRVIISDDWFPIFLRDNVKLETGQITRFTKKGIEVEGQPEEELDLVVFATGFRTVEFMHPINITGSAGRTLSSIWSKGGRALYGVCVESLPNFAMLYGKHL